MSARVQVPVQLVGENRCSSGARSVIISPVRVDPSGKGRCEFGRVRQIPVGCPGFIGLTKTMARDLAERHIRVNAVAPGTVRTPLTEPCYHDETFLRGVEGTVPLGFEGTADDVTRAVLFHVADLGSRATGTVLPVDGGWLAERNYAPAGSTAYIASESGSSNQVTSPADGPSSAGASGAGRTAG